MRMLNSVLEADVFEISRTPIQWPQFTKKGERDPLCAVPRPEPPVQVHHQAEDVAAAERVDVVDDREKRDIKTASPKRMVGQMIEHGTQTQTIGC